MLQRGPARRTASLGRNSDMDAVMKRTDFTLDLKLTGGNSFLVRGWGWGGVVVGHRALSLVISLNDHAVKLPSKSSATDPGRSQPWPEKLLPAAGSSQCEISENWS